MESVTQRAIMALNLAVIRIANFVTRIAIECFITLAIRSFANRIKTADFTKKTMAVFISQIKMAMDFVKDLFEYFVTISQIGYFTMAIE